MHNLSQKQKHELYHALTVVACVTLVFAAFSACVLLQMA